MKLIKSLFCDGMVDIRLEHSTCNTESLCSSLSLGGYCVLCVGSLMDNCSFPSVLCCLTIEEEHHQNGVCFIALHCDR